ncbi:SpoIIE family protein phosphatase [Modestobacter sp. I12A-02628]|uniref:Serine/threonine-protein phosphatase n=1 Tax=Goekera deserti TaxID=2497753 RepID=A0A7K3WJ37_9ACTN|nr:SpoIIE family protein phosphatase [Goekera deserti]NDI46556.1 SpoIIE family protein phosphatase [Goekera deserti]NEL56312.1 serine/threonine-protein phosphatase [Goekera deserti]
MSVLITFTLLDFAVGRGQVVFGLLVIVPLVAAFVLGRRATAAYAVVALVAAALLGVYNWQYTPQAIDTQVIRLVGIALGGVIAVAGCTVRLRNEARLATASAQAVTTQQALKLTEVLQRSLLTDPAPSPGLQVAVRYLPATRHAQIGGDWYDTFPLSPSTTMLVIGDVAGHDAPAAATMAQARGMLRAIATTATSPAAVLSGLDHAFAVLGITTLTTAVVATLDTSSGGIGAGPAAVLRWSNAGHPPPVVVCADGSTTLLERRPELLLGVRPDTSRTDHQVALNPGETVVLYTDGLVERRGVELDQSTSWLLAHLRHGHDRPLEHLVDQLLDGMAGQVDDDVAVLAVRLGPARPHRSPSVSEAPPA